MIRTALQPTFGKLYKVFNVKWVFLIAVTIFESISFFLKMRVLISSRLLSLCSSTIISRAHCWPSNRWCRRSCIHPLLTLPFLISGHIFRRVHSNSIHRSTPSKTSVLRIGRYRKRGCLGSRASRRRSIHRTCFMAVVVLSLPKSQF